MCCGSGVTVPSFRWPPCHPTRPDRKGSVWGSRAGRKGWPVMRCDAHPVCMEFVGLLGICLAGGSPGSPGRWLRPGNADTALLLNVALAFPSTATQFDAHHCTALDTRHVFRWGTLLGSWEWIYLDACLCLALAATLTMSLPSDKLAPSRPTASLLSPLHICSVFFQVCCALCCGQTQLGAVRPP